MLIVATVIGFYFRMPYAVVLFAGLYIGIAAIIPIIIGVAVWYFLPFFTDLAAGAPILGEFDLFEIPVMFLDIFADIHGQLTTDFNWMIVAFVFAMMILAVSLISKISMNHSKDIAIVAGAIVGIMCMSMVILTMNLPMSIFGLIISCIFSAGLIWIVKFFDNVMDYKRVERVEFEDESYFYYVKMIPKVHGKQTQAKPAKKETPPAPRPESGTRPLPEYRHKRPASTPPPAPVQRSSRATSDAPIDTAYRAKLRNQDLFKRDDED